MQPLVVEDPAAARLQLGCKRTLLLLVFECFSYFTAIAVAQPHEILSVAAVLLSSDVRMAVDFEFVEAAKSLTEFILHFIYEGGKYFIAMGNHSPLAKTSGRVARSPAATGLLVGGTAAACASASTLAR